MPIKGQVTIEYLMLTSIGILFLFLSIGALLLINSYWNHAEEHYYNIYDKAMLKSTIKEVCLLGSGNKRGLNLITKIENLSIDTECPLDANLPLYGSIEIENNDGVILVYNKKNA